MNFFKLIRNFIVIYILFLVGWYFLKDYQCSIWASQLAVAALLSIAAWTGAYFLYDVLHFTRISPDNKIVLVTGCDTGFGHQLVKQLDSYGFTVFAGVLFPEGEGARKLYGECSDRLRVIRLDVSKVEDMEKVIHEIERTQLPLWGIVNNAGIGLFVPFDWGNDVDEYRRMFDVNVLGTVRVTKHCIPLLRHSGGRIVNVSSLAGRFTTPSIAHYSMAKHSVRVFSDAIRRELYDSAVQVITLEPTFYQTAIINQEALNRARKRIFADTPANIQEAYKVSSLDKQLDEGETLANKVARSNLHEVTDAMMNAVTLENPKPYYRCCGYMDLTIWGISHAPEVLIDYGMHLFKSSKLIKAIVWFGVRMLTVFNKKSPNH